MLKQRVAQLLLATAAIDAAAGMLLAQTTTPIPATDVPALQIMLYDPAARADQRDQAAQRLLSRPDPAARNTLRAALSDTAHPAVQLAAARALGDEPVADASLVGPLFKLLDGTSPEPLLTAVGDALTAFKSDGSVLTQLLPKAAAGDDRVRVVAIRALGRFVDLQAAAAMLPLTDPATQPPRVADAANKALAYLTGYDPAATNAEFWRTWWVQNQGKSPAQFQADLTLARSSRYDRVRVASDSLVEEFGRMASEQYDKAPADQKPELLLRLLRSSEPSVRSFGCRLARQAAERDVTPQSIKEQLRVLVGDSHANVRADAARTLSAVNDRGAAVPLLTQLNQETDPVVKGAIADALGPIGDPRAIAPLLALLNDPSIDTAQSAAEAIRQTLKERDVRMKILQTDPNAMERIAAALMDALRRTTPRDNTELRNDLVLALVPLQSQAFQRPLLKMLSSPAETPRVRRALLAAAGSYGGTQFTDAIQPWLEDPNDYLIRLAAVQALTGTSSSLNELSLPLGNRIDPAKESHADVRDAAWKVMTGLFARAPLEQLATWENRLKNDPYKLLVVYREERQRLADAGQLLQVSDKDRQIGDLCVSKAVQLFNDAIAAYTEAATMAAAGNNLSTLGQINEGLATAYIRNHQYDQAIDFISAQIQKDPQQTPDLMAKIKIEATDLMDKDPVGAAHLLDRTLAMNPRPKGGMLDNFQQMLDHIRQLPRQQNRTPYPASDGVETAMAW